MKLGIIINCVGYDKNYAKMQVKFLKEVLPVLESLSINPFLIMPASDWVNVQLIKHTSTLPSQNIEEIRKILKSTNNKGTIVRLCIEEFKKDDVEAVLHIDGSGKFDLRDITSLVEIILDSSIDAVLTKRQNISGIDKFRTLVEEFEIELVNETHPSTNIEDGQSGCWCFKLDNDLNLSARGYEIELDVLINQIKNKKNIFWLPINVIDAQVTKYAFSDGIQKIDWLSKELKLRKSKILDLLEKFKIKKSEEIKEAEKHSIEINKPENTFKNYTTEIEKRLDGE